MSVQAAVNFLDGVRVDGVIVIAPRLALDTAVRKASFRVPVQTIAAGASSAPHMFTYAEKQASVFEASSSTIAAARKPTFSRA